MRMANLALAELTEALNRGWGDKDSSSYMLLEAERAGVQFAVPPEKLREVLDQDGTRLATLAEVGPPMERLNVIEYDRIPRRRRTRSPTEPKGDSPWNSAPSS